MARQMMKITTPKNRSTKNPLASPPPLLPCDELLELLLWLLPELWEPELCDPPELCPPPARANASAADTSSDSAIKWHFERRERGGIFATEGAGFVIWRIGSVQARGLLRQGSQFAFRVLTEAAR
jgi:hypothetical protein